MSSLIKYSFGISTSFLFCNSLPKDIFIILKIASFTNDPKSYITTVGLYNSANELLAVAKLSKPVLKSSSREALIKVRLDF